MKQIAKLLYTDFGFSQETSERPFGQFGMHRHNERYCGDSYSFLKHNMASTLSNAGIADFRKSAYRLACGYGRQFGHALGGYFKRRDQGMRMGDAAEFAGGSAFQIKLDGFFKIDDGFLRVFNFRITGF